MIKMVSVIVPIYNMREYLPTCIESLLLQTWPDLEIILIDDGSTDGSAQLCDEYAARDSRVVVLHKANGGVSSARNAALDVMRGEFVCFVDPDDFVAIDMVEKLLLEQRRTNADIIIFGYKLFWNDSFCMDVTYTKANEPSLKDIFSSLLTDENISNYSCNKFYRSRLFAEIRYPVGKIYEDISTIYRVLALSVKTVVLSEVLYFYRQRVGSLSKNPRLESLVDQICAIRERNLYISERFPELIGLATANELKFSIVNYNQISKAFGYKRESLYFFYRNIRRCCKVIFRLEKKYLVMGLCILFFPKGYANIVKKIAKQKSKQDDKI